MVKICQACGTQVIDDQSRFCTKCGAILRQDKYPLKTHEVSFNYSKKFYGVIGLDLLISFLIALGGLGNYIDISNPGYMRMEFLVISLISFFNLLIDGSLLSNMRKQPNLIDFRLCWIKCIFGFLGIFTVISGIYFAIISVKMGSAYKARMVRNRQDVRIENNKEATSGNPRLCSTCGAAIEQYSAYCPECKTILLYEKAEVEKAAKLQRDLAKENIVKLQDSGDIQLIQNYIDRYPNYDDRDQKFFNLNALLAKKGYILTTTDLMNLIREAKLQDELEKIKNKVFLTNPKTSDDFIKNYIKVFGYPDSPDNAFILYNNHPDQIHNSRSFLKIHCINQLLKELFDYHGNLREDFVRLRKDIELERFEKKLIGDQSLRITINDVDNISGYAFEMVLKALFEKMEYSVIHTPFSNDQGADLIIEKSGIKTVIQAKNWQNNVTNSGIQEAVAAIKHYNAQRAMVISSSGFTQSARELARSNNVVLWDRSILSSMLDENPIFRV